MSASHRVWRFPAGVDTDALAPGRYMKDPIEVIAAHCLESIRPEFAQAVRPGDVLVAGKNFGVGSSREQAPEALKYLGVSFVLAPSFSGLFYRNCINLGLPALVCAQAELLQEAEQVQIDALKGSVRRSDGSLLSAEPMPDFLWELVCAGGLMSHLQRTVGKKID